MELALLLAAITYMVRGKFDKDTSQAAYKAGKEPPSVVKHRRKWEQGGGKVSDSGKPAGPGATRLALSHRWANACEKAKERSDDKHRRWRAWFAEQAPQRDQKWREKQTNKIVKSEKRAEKFARARGILAHPMAARQEREAWEENARRDAAAGVDDAGEAAPIDGGSDRVVGRSPATRDEDDTEHTRSWFMRISEKNLQLMQDDPHLDQKTKDIAREILSLRQGNSGDSQADDPSPASDQGTAPASELNETTDDGAGQADSGSAPSAAVPAQSTGTTATTGGTVYQQAAQKLVNHADEIDGYAEALAQLSDDMGGVGWGSEVTEPLAEMRAALGQVSTIYSDLADQITAEGNRVNDAYDEAPWAPDKAALV